MIKERYFSRIISFCKEIRMSNILPGYRFSHTANVDSIVFILFYRGHVPVPPEGLNLPEEIQSAITKTMSLWVLLFNTSIYMYLLLLLHRSSSVSSFKRLMHNSLVFYGYSSRKFVWCRRWLTDWPTNRLIGEHSSFIPQHPLQMHTGNIFANTQSLI